MEEYLNLRDEEFRNLLIENFKIFLPSYKNKETDNIIHILNKNKITNEDYLKFYFKCINCSNQAAINEILVKSFFDYKMMKINNNEIVNIFKSICPALNLHEKISYRDFYWRHYDLYSNTSLTPNEILDHFYQLVDIFLDEI